MKNLILCWIAFGAFACASLLAAADKKNPTNPADPIYVLANDDGILHSYGTFFTAGETGDNPTLTFLQSVNTQGQGIGGGFFGAQRLAMLPSGSAQCVYVSDAGTNDIAAISIGTRTLIGNFVGSGSDNGNTNGIGMVVNQDYLYAGYTASNTIATFSIGAGCSLTFLGDITVTPLNGGWIDGMALNGSMLVVTYIDGSIQSFNTANGIPISNNDEQNTAGYAADYLANGVDITQDGHFAIFGDTATTTVVEVSDLSSGKLAPTVMYVIPQQPSNTIGQSLSSSTLRLSPDESLLYIGNTPVPYVIAAFFNKTTGKVSAGCTSPALNLFYNPWSYVGSLQTRDTTGTGNVLYVAEFGSSIGVLTVTSTGTACTLTESPSSPVEDELSPGLISIQVFPPRPF
jgi:hypothetical protein